MEIDIQSLRDIVRRVLNPDPVTYHPADGVTCPVCAVSLQPKEMGVTRTCPWSESVRVRYHTCPYCGSRWKSVETILSR